MLDEFELGEKIGSLTRAIDEQVKATEENTAVLRGVEARLIKGDARMDVIDGRVDALPCLTGKTLPPNCPVIPSSPPEPAADLAADAAKWRWIVSGWNFLRTHWQGLGIVGLLTAVFGERAIVYIKTIFGGGVPPAQ